MALDRPERAAEGQSLNTNLNPSGFVRFGSLKSGNAGRMQLADLHFIDTGQKLPQKICLPQKRYFNPAQTHDSLWPIGISALGGMGHRLPANLDLPTAAINPWIGG